MGPVQLRDAAHLAATELLRRSRLELEFAADGNPLLSPSIRALKRTETWLTTPPRLAILGEFNSGKSSLANLIAGIESLPTAVVSNTCIPTLLAYSRMPSVVAVYRDGRREPLFFGRAVGKSRIVRLDVGLPSPKLRQVQLLDLPGLADPRFGGQLDELLRNRPSAVVWCTVATQAWKESERAAWAGLPKSLRENAIMAVTFGDLLSGPQDRARVMRRLDDEVGRQFKAIVMICCRDPAGGLDGDPEASDNAWISAGRERLGGAIAGVVEDVVAARTARARSMAATIASHALGRLGT